ncbi:hypothetical protein FWK35_00002984 [Aphis craccivora]|uniref:Uncharacterized protein n=1 Tax=Aphis craccivora TaxID=307492 RepID=A0A6G0Z7B8_APHCR|nr:hypothetical protein FWK35_00002984 [Aphis craccivora]
MLVLSIYS